VLYSDRNRDRGTKKNHEFNDQWTQNYDSEISIDYVFWMLYDPEVFKENKITKTLNIYFQVIFF